MYAIPGVVLMFLSYCVSDFMFGSYNAGRSTVLRAQRLARERTLDGRMWPDIRTVAPTVSRWRYKETLTYVERIRENILRMDAKGRVNAKTER